MILTLRTVLIAILNSKEIECELGGKNHVYSLAVNYHKFRLIHNFTIPRIQYERVFKNPYLPRRLRF